MLFRIAIIISIILLIFLIISIDLNQVINILLQANPFFIVFALISLFIEIILKSWRLKLMTDIFSPLTFFNSLKVFLVGRPFGVVTPGQMGDLVRTYSLANKTGLRKTQALALSFLDKVFDLFFLIIFAALGLIIFLLINGVRKELLYLLFFILVIMIPFLILLTRKDWIRLILRPLFYLIIPKKYQIKFKDGLSDFYKIFNIVLKNKKLVFIFVISLLIWPIVSLRVWLLALAIGLPIQIIYFIAFVPAIAFIEMLPISIMGLGPREYAYILFFSFLQVSRDEAFLLSLLTLVTNGILVALIGYYFVINERLSLKKIQQY